MAASPDPGGAGFFLLRPDGSVLSSSGLAALLSGGAPAPGGLPVPDPSTSLKALLRLSPEQEAQFAKWLELVRKRHRDLRWEKIAPLAPIQEAWTGKPDEEGPVRLGFRKIEGPDGNLAAIAVIFQDPAPSRAVAERLEEERHRHRLEIRDVLALAANPPETVGAFLDDARTRLERAQGGWEAWLAARKRGGGSAPGLWSANDGESAGQQLFRELHMVKGNAGAFGFESLAAGAQAAEDLLEALKPPYDEGRTVPSAAGRNAPPAGERAAERLGAAVASLRAQFEESQRALKLIAGEGQDAMARILKWKLERIVASAGGIGPEKLDPPLRSLVESTRRLAFLSPAYLARKYRNLVERLAHSLGKHAVFRVAGNSGDVHPESFARVDEALVHILRNMVDHGIEPPAERAAAGKGEAEIELEYVAQEDRVLLRVRDNGRGMDPEAIADRAVSLRLVSRAEADALDEVGKLGLIFAEGFTTRREAGPVSGRGLGLALAARCVADRGGNLYVFSRPGEGSRFAIELPHVGQKTLPKSP
jgi:signal transduction histidine kinase